MTDWALAVYDNGRGVLCPSNGDGLNRELESPWQGDNRRGTDRWRSGKEFGKELVEAGERLGFRHETGHFHDLIHAASCILQKDAEIGERLPGLGDEAVAGRLAGRGIDARLAGSEDEVSNSDSLRVGAQARDTGRIEDGLGGHLGCGLSEGWMEMRVQPSGRRFSRRRQRFESTTQRASLEN